MLVAADCCASTSYNVGRCSATAHARWAMGILTFAELFASSCACHMLPAPPRGIFMIMNMNTAAIKAILKTAGGSYRRRQLSQMGRICGTATLKSKLSKTASWRSRCLLLQVSIAQPGGQEQVRDIGAVFTTRAALVIIAGEFNKAFRLMRCTQIHRSTWSQPKSLDSDSQIAPKQCVCTDKEAHFVHQECEKDHKHGKRTAHFLARTRIAATRGMMGEAAFGSTRRPCARSLDCSNEVD